MIFPVNPLSQLALRSFESARSLIGDDPWVEDPGRTFNLLSRLAAYVHNNFIDDFINKLLACSHGKVSSKATFVMKLKHFRGL